MQKVIPSGINYADIKPEAIDHQFKLVRFTPVANVANASANDVIRFALQGNGFLDPYSTYIRITLTVANDLPGTSTGADGNRLNAKVLDSSAHSLINRLVIRSQGTEIERIEQYDVIVRMINDIIYSHEQNIQHHHEGFPMKTFAMTHNATSAAVVNAASVPQITSEFILTPSARGSVIRHVGEPCFYNYFSNLGFDHSQRGLLEINTATGRIAEELLVGANVVLSGNVTELTFCIPIYSGLIGILMPDKKLIPLSLMPLEVEFTLNPHALYTVGAATTNRSYRISRFDIYAHMLQFESSLHRSLETVVSQHGIFVHYNSFYLAPITTNFNNTVAQFA